MFFSDFPSRGSSTKVFDTVSKLCQIYEQHPPNAGIKDPSWIIFILRDKDKPTIQLSMFSRTNKITSDLFEVLLSSWISVHDDGGSSNRYKLYGNTQSIGINPGNRVLPNRMVITPSFPDRYSNITFKEKGAKELCPVKLLPKFIRRSILSCFLIPGLRGTCWRQTFPGMTGTFKCFHGFSHPKGRPTIG
jgi:hypothetical protein